MQKSGSPVLSPKGKILVWNDAAAAISGYPKEETLGTASIWKRLYPDPAYRKWVTGEITRVITRDSYLEDFETEIRCRDGSKKTIAWNTKGLRNAEGNVENFIAVGRDVTERRKAEEAIAASEEKYRTLVERISDIIFSLDARGVITYISPAIEKISGYNPSELTGRNFTDFVVSDDLPVVREVFKTARNGSVRSFQFRIVNKSGEERWLRSSSEPTGKNEVFLGVRGVLLDVTEQKRSEDALQKSQSLLSNAMDLAHMASWEFEAGTGMFTFDDRFYALYGTTAEREGGYRMPAEVYAREFVHPDDMAVVGEEVRKAVETSDPGYTSQVEHRVIRRDGAVRYMIVRISITKDRTGRTIRTHGANQDITERRQAEEALKESEEKYRAYIENAVESIFIADKSGRYLDVNPSACQLVGYTRDELLSLSIPDLSDPDNLETAMAGFNTLLTEGRVVQEISLKKKDGTLVPVILNAVMLPDGNVMGFCTDITERKMTEDALALASRKLTLLSSITRHDILNQLMVLMGYLDMAVEDVTDPKQRKFIEIEILAAKTIQRQIEFTREYQELGLQAPVWLNINESLMQATANLPMRDVKVSIDRTDLEVFADRLFEKVFYNLIDNALRYGGDLMTSISVSSQEEESGLVIVFEDNGAGISADDKPKLFTRGFGKNTGLGLFLSREILAITGISIKETGEPGKGARFEIIVPNGMYRFTGMNSTGNLH